MYTPEDKEQVRINHAKEKLPECIDAFIEALGIHFEDILLSNPVKPESMKDYHLILSGLVDFGIPKNNIEFWQDI